MLLWGVGVQESELSGRNSTWLSPTLKPQDRVEFVKRL
jgi:hypothetical protein